MSETNLYRPIHPGTLSGARTTSLDSGIDSNSGRTSASGSTRGSSSFRDRNQHAHGPGGAPSVWFSAPDLRVARAAEADVVEPESLAQQRARARFFDDTSTDMRRGWYPVMMSSELRGGSKGDVVGMFLLGDPIVLWRDAEDIPVCLEDRCAHRNAPLSLARRTHDGKLECAYDGWTYDSEGAVTYIPALLADRDIPSNACARRYPTVEMDGLVWVWPGDPSQPAYDMHVRLPPSIAPGTTPHFSATGSKGISVAAGGDEIEDDATSPKPEEKWGKTFTQIMDLDVDNGLLVEWLLDFSHTSYTSQNLLGKALKPAALQCDINFGTDSTAVVANVHRPETNEPPVELKFIPPCHVQMTVEYNGYKAHQTFHCIPTQKGHTRLIFRHNRNYWTWLDNLPFVGALYNRRWIKTVLQSYNLLLGIQERLKAGARPWNAPIQADLLPRYYREWWKRAVKKEAWFNGYNPETRDISPYAPPLMRSTHLGLYNHRVSSFGALFNPRSSLGDLRHISSIPPSPVGIVQAASAAAMTATVQASGGASRRGSIANLALVQQREGPATSRRGSVIIMPSSLPPPPNVFARTTSHANVA